MSNTRLTVGDSRTVLERYVKSPAEYLSYLNQASERLIYSGKWKGNILKMVFDSSEGYITLDPSMLSVLGSTYNRWPTPIFGEFHPYFESGPGNASEAADWLGQLRDMGDGFCTQTDIIQYNQYASPPTEAVPGSIVLYCGGSDAGKTVRLYGIQEETGEPVTDENGIEGELVTLASPFVVSAFHYSKLTYVEKDETDAAVEAWVAPTGGGDEYQIAYWRPGETRPQYRRYQTGTTEKAIQVLCQRRFQQMRAETDPVYPGNLAALKFEIQAIVYEDAGYLDKAAVAHGRAIQYLNDEATSSRGGAQPSIPASTWGSFVEPIPQQH